MEFSNKSFSIKYRIKTEQNFSLSTRPADADQAAVYNPRHRALFDSVLRGPAAQWIESLDTALAWNEIRNQFRTRFTDAKDKYRKRCTENGNFYPKNKKGTFVPK